jgi:hypothetical protein
MTAIYNFTEDNAIQQGATFTRSFVWKSASGTPVDLTGYSAQMQVRKSVTSPDVIVELSTANSRIVLGGALGTIVLTLTALQTSAITAKAGVYDLELSASDGVVTRFLAGEVEISREVTR